MNGKDYLGDLIGGGLLIPEARLVCEALLKNLAKDEMRRLIVDENILQKKSHKTSIRYFRTIERRYQSLGKDFILTLIDSNHTVYVQLLLVGLIVNSPIVADFMRMILAESRRMYMPNIGARAWSDFYDARVKSRPILGEYSKSTIQKMGSNTIKSLVQAGYLNSSRERLIQPVFLMPEVEQQLLNLNRADLVPVMRCTI